MSEDKRQASSIASVAAARAKLATLAGNVELAALWTAVLVAARQVEGSKGGAA